MKISVSTKIQRYIEKELSKIDVKEYIVKKMFDKLSYELVNLYYDNIENISNDFFTNEYNLSLHVFSDEEIDNILDLLKKIKITCLNSSEIPIEIINNIEKIKKIILNKKEM